MERHQRVCEDYTEAVNTVVDAVVEAGKSIGEIVGDVVEFSQRRINLIVETLVDAGKEVVDFFVDLADAAYSVIEGITQGLFKALTDVATLLEEAYAIGRGFLDQVIRAFRGMGASIERLVTEAASVTAGLLAVTAAILTELATKPARRADYILDLVVEVAADAFEAVVDALSQFVDAAYRLAEWAATTGAQQAFVAQLRKAADAVTTVARSIIDGLLAGGVAIGTLLDLVWDGVRGFFEDFVQLALDVLDDSQTLFDAAVAIGDEALEEMVSVVASAGTALYELVEWARSVSDTAVGMLVDVLDQMGTVSRAVLRELAKGVVEAGQELGTLLEYVVDQAGTSIQAVLDGIVHLGSGVQDALAFFYENARDFLERGIEMVLDAGGRILDVLEAGLHVGFDALRDFAEHLRSLGRASWYVLYVIVESADDLRHALEAVFEGLLAAGETVGYLVGWCGRRAGEITRLGFSVLLGVGVGLTAILEALLTDPNNVFSTAVQALRDVDQRLEDLFEAIVETPRVARLRLLRALETLETPLEEMLDAFVSAGETVFVDLLEALLVVGVTSFEVLVWAVDTTAAVFGWVLDVFGVALDSLVDVLEWIASAGGDPVEWAAGWLVDQARDSFEWIRDEVVVPIVAVGKLGLLVTIAAVSSPFLAVALVALGSVVDPAEADYHHWPDDLRDFERQERAVTREIPPPADDRGIVVFSDVHVEDQDDIDAGLGHFHENVALFEAVLDEYAVDQAEGYEWTVVLNGDAEEFWIDNDLSTAEPADKVDSIVDTHETVYQTLSESFYTFEQPRRLVKVRGNHDAGYEDDHVVDRYRSRGFPDIVVYDYVLTRYDGQDVLITHGHQFDVYNCDANNDFGKFSSNFASEPFDVLSDAIDDVFPGDASFEGETVSIFGFDVPLSFFVPFYERDEWEDTVDAAVMDPELSEGLTFDEGLVADTVRTFDASMIIGHTHGPKVMRDSQDHSRFYVNSGTSGWWEGCVWTVELTAENVTLNGWTADERGEPRREFVVALEEPDDDFGDDPNRTVSDAEF